MYWNTIEGIVSTIFPSVTCNLRIYFVQGKQLGHKINGDTRCVLESKYTPNTNVCYPIPTRNVSLDGWVGKGNSFGVRVVFEEVWTISEIVERSALYVTGITFAH